MTDVVLYQFEISPFADKVRRALRLKSIEYSIVEVIPSKVSKFKTISPTGKFPALRWNDELIIDSTDILRFLDSQVPDPRLLPQDPKARALAHILEDWADESLYFYDIAIRVKPHNTALFVDDLARYETGLAAALMRKIIPPAMRKIGNTQGLARKSAEDLAVEIERHFEALEEMLEGNAFLLGDAISSADLSVASMLHVLIRAQEPAASLPKYQRLSAWKDRVDQITLG